MAARNPTSFTEWVDERIFVAGKSVLASEIDKVITDQVYILDAEQMVLTEWFSRACECAAGAFADYRIWHFDSKDMCGDTGVSNDEIQHDWCVFCWTSDGTTTGEAKLTSTLATADTSDTITIPAGTTPAWAGFGSFNIKTNGNEDTLTLAIRRTAGSGTVYVGGLGIFAQET